MHDCRFRLNVFVLNSIAVSGSFTHYDLELHQRIGQLLDTKLDTHPCEAPKVRHV